MSELSEFPLLQQMTSRALMQLSGITPYSTTTDNRPNGVTREQIYKHLPDRTLLNHIDKLSEIIKKFRGYIQKNPFNNRDGENIESIKQIIVYFNENIKSDLTIRLRYDIGYIDNFNNEIGNDIANNIFSKINDLIKYFQIQDELFNIFYRSTDLTIDNALSNNIDINIHYNSTIMCDEIISLLDLLSEYIKNEYRLDRVEAKGLKKRKKHKTSTRKKKKTVVCKKKKTKKSKSKKK